MKISLSWLRKFIEIQDSPEKIAHILTHAGLEVENWEVYEQVPGNLAGVVVGEVLECVKHPDADKLSLTQVKIDADRVVPIVCGAPNVATGQKVLVATVGTTLHPFQGEPFTIKKAKIRGAVSEGMICAEDELGLGDSHAGIMVLDTQLKPGTPASEYLNLEPDYIFEIGLTPNRADAASHLGVARDLKALLHKEIAMPDLSVFQVDNNQNPVSVTVQNLEACPRYAGITISGVTVQDSPDWLKKALNSIGVASINNIVDITNYVLHELGQPLHAFDADKISGKKVIVKTLPENTPFVTLDGKERKLKGHDLMICDEERGMCIAGVFGGIDSGITSETQNIFLESACFSPDYVRKTALVHGLKTDTSFRFERGTDPNMVIFALKRAALLIKEVAGGHISSDIVDIYPEKIAPFKIKVSYKNVDRLIGQRLDRDTIKNILRSLNIDIKEETEDGFLAVVPPHKVDVQREVDIVEEILRIFGYDNIKIEESLRTDYIAEFPEIDKDKTQYEISGLLSSSGFLEIITNSLTKPSYAEKIPAFKAEESVYVLNKLSEDLAVLRQSLLFSGMEVIAHNLNRRQKNLKFFEFGKQYRKSVNSYIEEVHLALFITGEQEKQSWRQPTKDVDFHDLYAIIQKILFRFRVNEFSAEKLQNPVFSYALQLKAGKEIIAVLGKVNKQVEKLTEVKQEVYYADIYWDKLLSLKDKPVFVEEISKFPEVRRDLSLVIKRQVTFEQIRQITQAVGSDLIKDINVFDVYEGESIGVENKAYALSFILQDKEKTLTDKIIDKTMQRLMNAFEEKVGATIRK